MKATLSIAWIAARELVYEKVFYMLVSFCALALLLSLLLGQLTYAEQAKLTLDFMLGGIELSMVLFSVFMGISLFHRELTLGSISMVLSKPIARASFIVGKFLGQLLVQGAVVSMMGAMTLLVSLRFAGNVSQLAIAQTVGMIFLEVTVLTAITYFFAVLAGGVTTAVATLCIFALGHLHETFTENPKVAAMPLWTLCKALIPNLEVFNMKALASYGIAASPPEVAWALLYGLCCATFFMTMAVVCFNRRDILT